MTAQLQCLCQCSFPSKPLDERGIELLGRVGSQPV